jgi:hypothetical protein
VRKARPHVRQRRPFMLPPAVIEHYRMLPRRHAIYAISLPRHVTGYARETPTGLPARRVFQPICQPRRQDMRTAHAVEAPETPYSTMFAAALFAVTRLMTR